MQDCMVDTLDVGEVIRQKGNYFKDFRRKTFFLCLMVDS